MYIYKIYYKHVQTLNIFYKGFKTVNILAGVTDFLEM